MSVAASNKVSATATDSIRFRRLRFAVIALCVLVIGAFAGSSAYDARRAYSHALVATHREIGNAAKTLAEQSAWTFQAVDLLLRDTARWYRNDSSKISPERMDEVLANRTAGARQIRLITIDDAQGMQRHRSRGSSPPNLDVSDRSYFIAQRDDSAHGLFVSEPLVTRSEGRPGIVLSRRLEDEKGAFAGVVTAIVDLEELEQFYSAVDLGRGSAIYLLHESGALLARNPRAADAFGRKFPELAAAPPGPSPQVVSSFDGKRDFVAVASVAETPLVIAATREVDVALQPWRDEATALAVRTLIVALLGAIAIAALLRQLRRGEADQRALQESEERYSLAMEGANEGHFDWDIATDRLFLSPKMKMLGGQSVDSAIATRSEWMQKIVIHADDVARFESALKEHFAGRTAQYDCEYRARQADGEWRWVHARGRCVRDAEGAPCRFVGSAIDITAHKQAQIDKEHLEAQLRQSQKMEAIGTLAGGIAHDFNNILGAILGYGEMAHRQSAEGSAMRRYLDNVMHAAGRAKDLVDRILGFSRSGLGERIPVHIQSIVEETLELLTASLPAGIRMDARLDAHNAAVIGDATHFHQVVMNLCTNALQAMEHGGVLGVVLDRVELRERTMLARGSLAPGPYVRLLVSDTGSGVPPAVFERMFDPFFTTKGVGEGTGLGLSLVHGIVTDLGGGIDVATQAGEGTTFTIWLPVAGEIASPGLEAEAELPHGNGQTVMIVDDERALVALAEEMLAEFGYEPVGLDSSKAALQAFSADPRRFDLVLTDEAMPELVGTELALEIRRLRPDIPIIVMSGYSGGRLAQRAGSAGVNEVLRKPLQRRDLAESLARVLGSTR
jgi:PAS domain S-box-containing protein